MSLSRMAGTMPDYERFFFCYDWKGLIRDSTVTESGIIEQWYPDMSDRDHYYLCVHQTSPRHIDTSYEIREVLDEKVYKRNRTITTINKSVTDQFDLNSDKRPVCRRYWQITYEGKPATIFEYIYPVGLQTVRFEIATDADIEAYRKLMDRLDSQYRGHIAWQVWCDTPKIQIYAERSVGFIDGNEVRAYMDYLDPDNIKMPTIVDRHDFDSPIYAGGDGKGPIDDPYYAERPWENPWRPTIKRPDAIIVDNGHDELKLTNLEYEVFGDMKECCRYILYFSRKTDTDLFEFSKDYIAYLEFDDLSRITRYEVHTRSGSDPVDCVYKDESLSKDPYWIVPYNWKPPYGYMNACSDSYAFMESGRLLFTPDIIHHFRGRFDTGMDIVPPMNSKLFTSGMYKYAENFIAVMGVKCITDLKADNPLETNTFEITIKNMILFGNPNDTGKITLVYNIADKSVSYAYDGPTAEKYEALAANSPYVLDPDRYRSTNTGGLLDDNIFSYYDKETTNNYGTVFSKGRCLIPRETFIAAYKEAAKKNNPNQTNFNFYPFDMPANEKGAVVLDKVTIFDIGYHRYENDKLTEYVIDFKYNYLEFGPVNADDEDRTEDIYPEFTATIRFDDDGNIVHYNIMDQFDTSYDPYNVKTIYQNDPWYFVSIYDTLDTNPSYVPLDDQAFFSEYDGTFELTLDLLGKFINLPSVGWTPVPFNIHAFKMGEYHYKRMNIAIQDFKCVTDFTEENPLDSTTWMVSIRDVDEFLDAETHYIWFRFFTDGSLQYLCTPPYEGKGNPIYHRVADICATDEKGFMLYKDRYYLAHTRPVIEGKYVNKERIFLDDQLLFIDGYMTGIIPVIAFTREYERVAKEWYIANDPDHYNENSTYYYYPFHLPPKNTSPVPPSISL